MNLAFYGRLGVIIHLLVNPKDRKRRILYSRLVIGNWKKEPGLPVPAEKNYCLTSFKLSVLLPLIKRTAYTPAFADERSMVVC